MAIITTPGAADANSYASKVQADTYHANRANAAWTGTDAAKEAALIRATQWLDGRYRSSFPGTRTNGREQALAWPRSGVVDEFGASIDSAAIPAEIMLATCEAAIHELVSPGILSPVVTPSQQKVLIGVGSLTWKPLGSSGVQSSLPVITAVDGILSGLFSVNHGSSSFLARA